MEISTVRTHVKFEDLREFYKFHLPLFYYGILYVSPLSSVVFISGLLLSAALYSPEGIGAVFEILKQNAFMPLILPFLFRYFFLRFMKSSYEQEKRFFENQIYEFSTQGVMMQNANSVVRLSWNDIVRFGESKHSFYIYITRAKAYVVPKRDLDPRTMKFLQTKTA